MPITPKLLLTLRFATALIVGVLLFALFAAWRADRRDRAQLAADLATSKQALVQATARQHDRDAQLQQALAAIAAQKRKIVAPNQILRDLPKQLPLPSPIQLQSPADQEQHRHAVVQACPEPCRRGPANLSGPDSLDVRRPSQTGHTPGSNSPAAVISTDDLKPLYDFALDCKACQAKLATAQADLADEKAKTVILSQQRDEAIRLAKGGSILRRIEQVTKWFLIGAAAGAIAAQARR